jgi:hypothetical protein
MLKYDNDGSLIEVRNENIISREITSFNNIGKYLEWISYNEIGAIQEIRTWQFDENNKIVEWAYLNPDRTLKYKETSTYDEYGNRVEYVAKDYKEVFEYNENNQLIARYFYENHTRLKFSQFYEYDSFGNKIVEKLINTDGQLITEFKYDENNLLVEQTGGVMNYRTIFIYNARKELINEKVYDSNQNIISNCFYDYDENGEILREWYED